jgi:predicted nucleic acid-binding protein
MYAAGRPHAYRDACARVLTEIASGRLSAAIDAEVIQEILYRYGALQQWNVAETMCINLLRIVPVALPVTVADTQVAIDLFRQYGPRGIRARDILHAAVMRNNGITTIVSTDGHFDQIGGIARVDPLALASQLD